MLNHKSFSFFFFSLLTMISLISFSSQAASSLKASSSSSSLPIVREADEDLYKDSTLKRYTGVYYTKPKSSYFNNANIMYSTEDMHQEGYKLNVPDPSSYMAHSYLLTLDSFLQENYDHPLSLSLKKGATTLKKTVYVRNDVMHSYFCNHQDLKLCVPQERWCVPGEEAALAKRVAAIQLRHTEWLKTLPADKNTSESKAPKAPISKIKAPGT